MDKQVQHLEGNRNSQTKNPQTNITENKQIELNTVHGEGSASEADLEDVSEIPSILLPGLGRNKTFTYQNQFMIPFMNANYIQIAYLTRTSKVFVLWMDLWFQGQWTRPLEVGTKFSSVQEADRKHLGKI